jgi:hypothetical protein
MMHKTLVLGVLLVFALSGQAPSGNHPLVSMPGTESISAAATPQVTPVIPKKDTPKAPAVPKTPQLNPSLVAVTKMLNEAKEMRQHMRLYQQEMNKIQSDLTMMQNPSIRARVESLKDKYPATKIDQLIEATADLNKAMLQVLNANGTK